ncbi:MAG: DUF2089 domain-containing protein [Candidatus Bipolaricaulia bacterium]
MSEKVIGKCPVCGADMSVTELECSSCHTKVSGKFDLGKFSRLDKHQLEFVEVFVRLRGNIKEVEEELDISYPTVRKKLDNVIETLGYSPEEGPEDTKVEERNEVLTALDQGEIDFDEAMKKLENL